MVITSAELKTIEQAIRKKWDIPEGVYKALPATLVNILLSGSNREKIAAARVIAAIREQDEDSEPKLSLVAHKHSHEIIARSTDDIESKRQELSERIARLS
ncbi:MAG: hypothetical protein JNL58_04390 [Planctomyces sp.]|nr:hypothetical protein [Planctomyces sp.]